MKVLEEQDQLAQVVVLKVELELELIQTQMTQKPMLQVEVGARALRNQTGGGGGWEGASSAVCGSARSSVPKVKKQKASMFVYSISTGDDHRRAKR